MHGADLSPRQRMPAVSTRCLPAVLIRTQRALIGIELQSFILRRDPLVAYPRRILAFCFIHEFERPARVRLRSLCLYGGPTFLSRVTVPVHLHCMFVDGTSTAQVATELAAFLFSSSHALLKDDGF
jgi:hypothetical protein